MGATNGNGNGWRWHKVAQRVARDYGSALGPSAWAVYYALVMSANNDTGYCYPAKKTIAEMWGLSRRTVDAAMLVLLEHRPQLVRCVRHRADRGTFASNDYHLVDPFDGIQAADNPQAGDSPASSMGELNTELVSAQNLRVDHAQNLPIPRAEFARGEANLPSPCAEIARGESPAEWRSVREMLTGRIDSKVLDWLDKGQARLDDERIVVTFDNPAAVHQVQMYASQIAHIAQRVTKTERPVEFVLSRANGGGHAW